MTQQDALLLAASALSSKIKTLLIVSIITKDEKHLQRIDREINELKSAERRMMEMITEIA